MQRGEASAESEMEDIVDRCYISPSLGTPAIRSMHASTSPSPRRPAQLPSFPHPPPAASVPASPLRPPRPPAHGPSRQPCPSPPAKTTQGTPRRHRTPCENARDRMRVRPESPRTIEQKRAFSSQTAATTAAFCQVTHHACSWPTSPCARLSSNGCHQMSVASCCTSTCGPSARARCRATARCPGALAHDGSSVPS